MSTELSPMMAGLQLGGQPGTSPGSSSVLSLASADPYDETEAEQQATTGGGRAESLSAVGSSSNTRAVHGPVPDTLSGIPAGPSSTETLEKLIEEVHRLQDMIYEIEELRHASTSATQLDTHLSALEARVSDLSHRIDKALADLAGQPEDQGGALRVELESEWGKVLSARALLKEEVKEDGWLVRFRATADQAEAMMHPLQNSLAECQDYLDSSLHMGRHDHLVHHRSPDVDRLKSLAKGHETMKSSYVPSIVKVLKMMEKSLASRTTRNGEALRRHAELSARWHKLQASLIELDTKLDYFINEDGQNGERYPIGNGSPTSPFGGSSSAFSGIGHGLPRDGLSSSHRSSFSSASVASGSSSSQKASLMSPPTSHLPLRSRDTMASVRSSATATSSARRAPAYQDGHDGAINNPAITPRAAARQSSFGSPHDGASGVTSPSPSKNSGENGQGATTPSRIPVSRMRSVSDFKAAASPPARSVSESLRPKTPTMSSSRGMPQSARSGRMSLGAVRTPSAGSRTYTSTGPSTAPRPRQSLSRAPPSSYRPVSPTPPVPPLPRGLTSSTSSLAPPRAGASSRPSSRMSTSSAVPWSREHGVGELEPFHPSPYDPLDQRMQQILDATDWGEFVARVDPPLKKGQRKGEHEECKGEFVFREGEKPVGVKMLRIARGKEVKDKVMVRTGGMWIDLEGWLRKRQEESLGIYG